jgi:hypothetical protein
MMSGYRRAEESGNGDPGGNLWDCVSKPNVTQQYDHAADLGWTGGLACVSVL